MELTQEQRTMVLNLIKEKTNPAWAKMETLTICKGIYDSMVKKYPKEMECFKNCIFWDCVIHPEWDELTIIADVMKGTEIETRINNLKA